MSDDLDDLLRGAMKTLDDQVPSGYLDALPNKVLARLEGNMQSTTGTTSEKRDADVPPPAATTKQRDEDSGLHDIRSLAQSTKQRLTTKRSTNSPPHKDDDIVAASSAGWVALPEPARMVSLPALDELPSAKEVKQQAKEQKAFEKAARKASAAELPLEMPVTADPARPTFGAHMATRKKSKAPLAIGGVLLAAAAGVAIYMVTQQGGAKSDEAKVAVATPVVAAEAPPAAAPAAAAAPTPPPPPVQVAAAEPAPADPAAAGDTNAKDKAADEVVAKAETPAHTSKPMPSKKGTKTKAVGKAALAKPDPEEQAAPPPVEKKPAPTDDKKAKGGKDGEGEPSFDALLKEAGVDETKKQAKPKLANKSLSSSDFKSGMSAVAGKAQGCYKGTQGTAMLKMSVSPSGQVTSVAVTGAFAGKPEASCVESAVKSAHFPAWDGGPQTFTYSYLLAE